MTDATVPCPVCAGPGAVMHVNEEFTLRRCSVCDHCFTDLASLGELEQYAPEYFEEEHRNWFQRPNLALFEKLARRIFDYKQNASVLDIGCGNGNFLRYLAERSPKCRSRGLIWRRIPQMRASLICRVISCNTTSTVSSTCS